jgi:hypothetical protein
MRSAFLEESLTGQKFVITQETLPGRWFWWVIADIEALPAQGERGFGPFKTDSEAISDAEARLGITTGEIIRQKGG